MRETWSIGSPDQGEWLATRARPLSITTPTPSIVTELSATLVDRMTLRWLQGATARSCSSGDWLPCNGSRSQLWQAARLVQADCARRDSAGAGRNKDRK